MARKGKMISNEINSEYLNETLTVKLYIPESLSVFEKFYLCIMLDGDDYYQLGRAATLSDRLHESGDITNVILAGVHYKNRHDRWDKYHPEGEKYDSFLKFLRFEVTDVLTQVLPSEHVEYERILIGDSLAGTASLLTAVKYPNAFQKVVMQSPYVDEHVLKIVNEANDELIGKTIYHTIGKDETLVKMVSGLEEDFLSPNRSLNEVLKEKVNDYFYDELDGQHTWKQWQKDLPNVFKHIFND